VLELYRRHPDNVRTLIFADTYAGWKGSLPEEEVQARLKGVRAMVAAGGRYDPPGLFAGEPPAGFASLLDEMTTAVRPASLMRQLSAMAETASQLLPRSPSARGLSRLAQSRSAAERPHAAPRRTQQQRPRFSSVRRFKIPVSRGASH
jgi:hypothetical protein